MHFVGTTVAIAIGISLCIAPAVADPVTIAVTRTDLRSVTAVSRTGRYVVSTAVGSEREELRDLTTGNRLALFPMWAESTSLSDNGRYVTYSMPVGGWGRRKVMMYDRRTDTTRNITRRSNGRILKPSWRGRCTYDLCEEDQKLRYSPQLSGGQISGNGRYVVFAANFRDPRQIDVYIKDLRTGKLRNLRNAGRPMVEEGDKEYVQEPTVSEDAATILIPGKWDGYESGDYWEPGRAIFDRSRLVEIGGFYNTMTRDGRTITINGPFSGYSEGPPRDFAWYDVLTGTSIPADPAGLRLTLYNSSRDGRYVAWRASSTDHSDPLQIRDRTAAVNYDLQSALIAAGYTPDDLAASGPMSGDGQVVFVYTNVGLVAVRWAA